ncbi:MAG: glycosyltransferase [Thermoanaerobaculia bacterium]
MTVDAKSDAQVLPDVSVVIPTFDRAGMVERAVESALGASREVRVEVVVVDDGSTDDTRERLERYAGEIVTLAMGRNRGRNHARNAGLRRAQGEWVKFLDSDDVLEPGALCQEVAAGRAAGADIVASTCRVSDLDGGVPVVLAASSFERGIDSILAGDAVPTSAALYRRDFIAEVEWDPALSKLDDWDYFTRVFLKGARLVTLPAVSYTWFSHSGQGIRRSCLLENAREHHVVLRKLEARIAELGQLTEARKRRLAQYFYKELRVLSLQDREAFEGAAAHILELDERFVPRDEERQSWMRYLARLIGFRGAVLFHSAVKRVLRGVPALA